MKKKQKERMIKLQQALNHNAKEGIKKEAVDVSLAIMFYISILVLRDKYGFGKKRLGDFMEHASTLIKDMSIGLLDFKDIRDTILEETGVEIKLPERKWL
ncbi:hypothetical protein ABGF48_01345 [Helcococcus bovis]|uniref:hypothetical protein n=1 Tax=Helcococcus bovis TaxID=3153252 RepID=UPI0038BA3C76